MKKTPIFLAASLLGMILLVSCQPDSTVKEGQNLEVADPETVGMSTERMQRIDKVLKEYSGDQWISGSVGIIVRHGKIVYEKGFGYRDIENGDAMDPTDIFRIASMSKAITSVAVMMLYEEGSFLLDDPVWKYIPEFKDPVILESVNPDDSSFVGRPATKQITIRQLLNHTSGIGYGFSHPQLKLLYDKAGIPDGFEVTYATLGEKIKLLARMPLLHEPGEKFTYGLNTDVLGYFVEVISGKSFRDFLQERIFDPLGMKDTYFFLDEEMKDRLVTIYEPDGNEGIRPSVVKEYQYPLEGGKSYDSGGAGLLSTARDYVTFLQMILNHGTYNGRQILGRKTIEIMAKNQVGQLWNGNEFGLGFGINTEEGSARILSSPGNLSWGGYFSTSFWIDPAEDLAAVLMTQMCPAPHGEIHQKFQVLTYQAIIE